MKKGAIENLGADAQKKSINLSVQGLSNQAIADELNKDFNTSVTSDEVKRFIARNKNKSIQIIKEDKNFQSKMVEEYFDTIRQIKEINSEMWKVFYALKKNPEYKDKIITCTKCHHRMILNIQSYGLLLKAADTILRQIQHVDQVLGRLKNKSFNVNYNFVDLSKKIAIVMPKMLNDLEKRGIAKIINKRKFREYYQISENTEESEIDETEEKEEQTEEVIIED